MPLYDQGGERIDVMAWLRSRRRGQQDVVRVRAA